MSDRRILVVMARQPIAGHVKTRLAPELGDSGAADLYRAMLDDVIASMRAVDARLVVAVTPASAVDWFVARYPDVSVIAQRGESLGERMIAVFDDLLPEADVVVMRNSDSPDLAPSAIGAAFDAAVERDADVVFGPDEGGGYHLVGMKAGHPELFGVAMSTDSNLEATIERARSLGLAVRLLDRFPDVDTHEDLAALAARLQAAPASTATRTRDALRVLGVLSCGDRRPGRA